MYMVWKIFNKNHNVSALVLSTPNSHSLETHIPFSWKIFFRFSPLFLSYILTCQFSRFRYHLLTSHPRRQGFCSLLIRLATHKHFLSSYHPNVAISIFSADINVTISPEVSYDYMPFIEWFLYFPRINNCLNFGVYLVDFSVCL